MKLFYDSEQNVLHVDQAHKTTMLTMPEEMDTVEKRRFLQSATLYAIIEQLTRKED